MPWTILGMLETRYTHNSCPQEQFSRARWTVGQQGRMLTGEAQNETFTKLQHWTWDEVTGQLSGKSHDLWQTSSVISRLCAEKHKVIRKSITFSHAYYLPVPILCSWYSFPAGVLLLPVQSLFQSLTQSTPLQEIHPCSSFVLYYFPLLHLTVLFVVLAVLVSLASRACCFCWT